MCLHGRMQVQAQGHLALCPLHLRQSMCKYGLDTWGQGLQQARACCVR